MTKEEIESKIESLQKGIDDLKAELDKPKQSNWRELIFKDKKGDYYYIRSHSNNSFKLDKNNDLMKNERKPEHAFVSEEDCELMIKKFILFQEMAAFAHVRNEGWAADWNDSKEYKYGLFKSFQDVIMYDGFTSNTFCFGIAFKSQEIAEEAKVEFGERLIEIYNKQY